MDPLSDRTESISLEFTFAIDCLFVGFTELICHSHPDVPWICPYPLVDDYLWLGCLTYSCFLSATGAALLDLAGSLLSARSR